MKRMIKIFLTGICLVLICSSCGGNSNEGSDSVARDTAPQTSPQTEVTMPDSVKHVDVKLFDIGTDGKTHMEILKELEAKGILKIESIEPGGDNIKHAIVEFAGVKFGMSSNAEFVDFNFISSSAGRKEINSLVKKISKYYGQPFVEGDEEDPRYQYYTWPSFVKPGYPLIKIRPIHSDDGGIYMSWSW